MAQWNIVAADLLATGKCGGMSFKDGILWIASENEVWMSKDTGNTWTQRGNINSIGNTFQAYDCNFFDSQNGIIATSSGFYQTKDQGFDWYKLTVGPLGHSACFGATPDIVSVCSVRDWDITTDGGITWATVISGKKQELEKVLYLKEGIFECFGMTSTGGHIFSTSDNGVTFEQHTGTPDFDSWSFDVDSSDHHRIYLVNEDVLAPSDAFSQLFLSTDDGLSFQTPFSRPLNFFSGSIAQACNAIYCPTITDGIYRSTDHGMTWQSVGGPNCSVDTRLISAITDNIVIVVDDQGNVWKTTTGGNGGRVPDLGNIRSMDITADTIGGTIYLPIIIPSGYKLSDIMLSMHFDTSILVYQGAFLNGKNITDISMPGLAKLHIDNTSTVQDDSMIIYAAFKYFPNNNPCTTVLFDSISIASSGLRCASIITTFSAKICSNMGCSAAMLSNYLRYGKAPQLSIVPNPSSGFASIHSDMNIGEAEIEVYDILGELKMKFEDVLSSSHSTTFDISGLPSGLYSIRVREGGNVMSLRMMHTR